MERKELGLTKRIGNATQWSFATELLAKIIVPITNMILARLLVPEAFGLIATIQMVISFSEMFTEAGFGQYLIHKQFDSKEQLYQAANVAFWTNFVIAGMFFLNIILFSKELARIIGCVGSEIALTVACLAIPINSISSVQIVLCQKELNFKTLFYNRMIASLIPLIFSTAFAILGYGYWSLIIGTLLSNIAKAVVLTYRSSWKPKFWYKIDIFKSMFSFSFWILMEALAMWSCSWIDIFLVNNGLGNYYTGIYKTSQTTVTGILSVITASVNTILFSSLAHVQNNPKLFKMLLYKFQRIIAILVVPLGFGIFLFKDTITMILLGKQWIDAAGFIGMWGFCMALVATMGTFCREALRAKGLPKVSFIAQCCHLIFVIPICLYGVKQGFEILITIRSLAYLQIIPLLHFCVYRYLDISPAVIWKQTVWPFLCSLLMTIVAVIYFSTIDRSIGRDLICICVCVITYFTSISIRQSYRVIIQGLIYGITNKIGIWNRKLEHDTDE